ncbi:hypothetical protein [Bacteroides stercoris]
MKKEEKRSSTSRWNDTSSSCIIYRATEEERKEGQRISPVGKLSFKRIA